MTDTSLGLTHIKDQSKLDMTDFMGGNSTPYIYIVSGYKEQTLFEVERFNIHNGTWEDVQGVQVA